MHLSPKYFSDLIKKETGKSALDFIHAMVTTIAKEMAYDESLSLSEIAYRLGFKYPQHFSRFFKRNTGMTPNQYRGSISAVQQQE
ncbi:MAG: helix-turn-helix domain-containing protein [Muribaculum sp.]|nr:helix-turn-helix domain-containing protein [Muribaculum sp.]